MAQGSAPGRSRIPQTFHRTTGIWKHLGHPNIVPLLGVTVDPPRLVPDRVPGGSLAGCVAGHPDADRLSLASDLSTSLCEMLAPTSAV